MFNDLQLPGGKAGLLKGPRAPSGGGCCAINGVEKQKREELGRKRGVVVGRELTKIGTAASSYGKIM